MKDLIDTLSLREYNEWYDSLASGKRFFFFLVTVVFPISMAMSGTLEWNWVQTCYMVFVVWWFMTRVLG